MPDPNLAEVEARISKFLAELVKMRGLDHEDIRALHVGDEREAVLTVSDLTTLLAEHRRRGEALEALRDYAQHSAGCGVYGITARGAGQCDCGLSQALGASDER